MALAIGAGLFATGMSYWLEASLKFAPALILLILIVPIIEEVAKFLAFRAIRKQDTLIVVLTFLLLETLSAAVQSGARYEVGTILVVALFSLGVLKHILFWIPEKLANFSVLSLPAAIIIHIAWNAYTQIPDGRDVIPAALLALATLPLLLVLYRESKISIHLDR